MAAVLAHEVRNPLAGIRGAMQVLMGRRKPDDPERAVMQEILARTESLNELIDDLLLFARPRPPRPAAVELAPLLNDVFATMLQDPAGQGVEFEAVGPPLTVLADADLTRATIFNLVLNAAQALAGHGRITVSTRRRREGWSRCRCATRALASRRRFASRSSSRSSRPSRAAVASGCRLRSGRWNCTAGRCR